MGIRYVGSFPACGFGRLEFAIQRSSQAGLWRDLALERDRNYLDDRETGTSPERARGWRAEGNEYRLTWKKDAKLSDEEYDMQQFSYRIFF